MYIRGRIMAYKLPYYKQLVPVPESIKDRLVFIDTPYGTNVEYVSGLVYDPVKRMSVQKRTILGRIVTEDRTKMRPTDAYREMFPDTEWDEELEKKPQQTVKVGPYIPIKKYMRDKGLTEMLVPIFGKDAGLFMDLASYMLIVNTNEMHQFANYAWLHPMMNDKMSWFSDDYIYDFIQAITTEQKEAFLDAWNDGRDKEQKITVSYLSNGRRYLKGNVEVAQSTPCLCDSNELGYFVAWDEKGEPLFYETGDGYLTAKEHFVAIAERAEKYGYKNIEFIIDAGCLDKGTYAFFEERLYSYLIMVKGSKPWINGALRLADKADRTKIKGSKVTCTSLKVAPFPFDKKERTVHICYDPDLAKDAQKKIEMTLERGEEELQKSLGREINELRAQKYKDLFDLKIEKKDGKNILVSYKQSSKRIQSAKKAEGYFVIIPSDDTMSAEQAFKEYNPRSTMAGVFRTDRQGSPSMIVYPDDDMPGKQLIEFMALLLKEALKNQADLSSGVNPADVETVRRILEVLESIYVTKQDDGHFRYVGDLTPRQQAVLNSYGYSPEAFDEELSKIDDVLIHKEDVLSGEKPSLFY